jgi:hypothetical protein
MTEDQLKSIPAFARLPVYDERDERADAMTRTQNGYLGVRECSTMDEVLRYLQDSQYVPLGGLKAWANGGPIVVAYFAERK